jgi:hypothetical protein
MGKRKTPDERVKALEAKCTTGRAEPPVVTMLPNETPDEARARLTAAGRKAPVLLVPTIPDVETWTQQTARYQHWLLRRTGDMSDPPSTAEIERAYRAALEGSPL